MPGIVGFMPTATTTAGGAAASMPAPPGRGQHRVVALALDGVVLLDLAAPSHLFGHLGARRYSFGLASLTPGPVRTSTGFDVVASLGADGLTGADTVVVPGLAVHSDVSAIAAAAELVAGAHATGARVMSICTGAFVLAEAGLLDGRRATTHWIAAEELARRYPRIAVDPSVLYVDEGSVLTSAGVAAGLDLCLHVIRRDHGAAIAAAMARRTVVAPHRDGGQAQFVVAPIASDGRGETSLQHTRAWALDRLDRPLDVRALARQACMSPRSFARHFRRETGITPAQWVLEQRTRAAQALLETTDLPIEAVATRTGFGSAATLRLHFSRRLATTPTAYRRTFRPR
jgi:transcriptional regulator GlxA family with amidase domain